MMSDCIKIKRYERALLAMQMHQSGIGGSMLTEFTCLRCQREGCSANTSVPIFCDDCSKDIRDEERDPT